MQTGVCCERRTALGEHPCARATGAVARRTCATRESFSLCCQGGERRTPRPLIRPCLRGLPCRLWWPGLTDSRTRPHGAPQHRDERALPGGSTALPLGVGQRASKTRNVTMQKMLVLMLSDTRPGQVNLRQTGKPFMINECP